MTNEVKKILVLCSFICFEGSNLIAQNVTTIAGLPGLSGSANGTGSGARFNFPYGIAIDASDNLYIGDESNHKIRKITPLNIVSTVAGTGGVGYTDGIGLAANFHDPIGIAVDALGNLFIADFGNNKIRKINSLGIVTTFAGTGAVGSTNGNGNLATFNTPIGVAVNVAGDIFVTDRLNNLIRKITATGVVSTFAGSGALSSIDGIGVSASFQNPSGITIDAAGNLYVTEIFGRRIRKITPGGNVTTIAGSGNYGSANGIGTAASFSIPVGICVDAAGNLYVSEQGTHLIRKISPTGLVTTLAGTGNVGSVDAIGTLASFYSPSGIAVNSLGNILYVTDQMNYTVRKITLTNTPPCPSCTLSGNIVVGGSTQYSTLTCDMHIPVPCGSVIDGTVRQNCGGTSVAFPAPGIIRRQPGNVYVGTTVDAFNITQTFSSIGTYSITYKKTYANGTLCGDSCTLYFDVTGPCSACAAWNGKAILQEGQAYDENNIPNSSCGDTVIVIKGKKFYPVGARDCAGGGTPTHYVKVTDPDGVVVLNVSAVDDPPVDSVVANKCGIYKVELFTKCGTQFCDTCVLYVKVDCTLYSECEGNIGYQINFDYNLPTSSPLSSYKMTLELYKNGILINCPPSSQLVKTSPSNFTTYTGNQMWYVSVGSCPQLSGCIDYRILITKQVAGVTTVIQTIGGFGNKGTIAGMNNDLCCGMPPTACPCPSIKEAMLDYGGHCAIKDTIENPCNKVIVSWTLTVNGILYNDASHPLIPQNIAANATVIIGDLLFINLPNSVIPLVYTFTYADGSTCIITKEFDAAGCNLPPVPCPSCTVITTATFQGQTINLSNSSSANPVTLNCNKNYTLLNTISCNPNANFVFDFNYAYVKDNWNQNWTITTNATGTQLQLPGNMPGTRTYTLYLRWYYVRSIGDTCFLSKAYPFIISCSPCNASCVPSVSVSGNGTTFTLVAGTSYSSNFECDKTYTFTPNLNCTPANLGITVNHIKVFDVYNNQIATPPSWLQSFIAINGIGNLVIPATTTEIYKIRYYYGIQNNNCDSFQTLLNITCTQTCPCTSFDDFSSKTYLLDEGIKKDSAVCGGSLNKVLACNKLYGFASLFIINSGANSCLGYDSAAIKDASGGLVASYTNVTMANPISYSFTQAGAYTVTQYIIKGGAICKTCTITVKVECAKDCCNGGYWEKHPFITAELDDSVIAELDCKNPVKIIFDDSHNTKYCNTMFVINAGNYICGDTDCKSKVVYTLSDNNSSFVVTDFLNMDIPADIPNGNYTLTMEVYCGDKLCEKCEFPFIKDCKTCDCPTANCTFKTYYLDQSGTKKSFVCNQNLQLECNKTYPFVMTVNCQANCPYTVTGELFDASWNLLQSQSNVSATNPFNVVFTKPGTNTYKVRYRIFVNGVECDKCYANVTVTCPSPVCSPCNATISNTSILSLTNNNTTGISQLTQSFSFSGLPASVTQVRAVVTNLTITATDENGNKNNECLFCIDKETTWGSIVNGTGITGLVPTVNINGIETAAPVSLLSNQNPREITWFNNGSVFSVVNPIQLSYLLPAKSVLTCCIRKATICIKFIFRNDKCEECVVRKCFDVELK